MLIELVHTIFLYHFYKKFPCYILMLVCFTQVSFNFLAHFLNNVIIKNVS